MRLGRIVTTTGLGLLLVLAVASPALADVTGGCDGQAVIDGVTYTPANDSASNPIVVPDADGVVIPWEGSAPFDNNGHHGDLRLHLGPATIKIAEWADDDPSEPNESGADGVHALDDVREQLPFAVRGLYRVSGAHSADGGSCTGFVMLRFDGPTLDSPVAAGAAGMGGLGLLAVALAAVVTHAAATAGRVHGRQLLGLAGGLVLGVAVAVLLQQASVWPLDTLSSIGLPLLAAILGLLAGRWAPFGRGRLATAAATSSEASATVERDDEYRWVEGRQLPEPPDQGSPTAEELVGARRVADLLDDEWSGRLGSEDARELRKLIDGDSRDAWRRVLGEAESKPADQRSELERRIIDQKREIRESLQQDPENRSELQRAAQRLADIIGSDASPAAGATPDGLPDGEGDEPEDDDGFDPDDLTPIVPLT